MYLALNWFLTDRDDELRMPELMQRLATGPQVYYSHEEVEEHIAQSYVGRLRTKRLRKKHADTHAAIDRSKKKAQKIMMEQWKK